MRTTEEVLLRIIVGENDKHGHVPTFEVILDLLRRHGVAGATAYRGIAGYGKGSVIHTHKLLELSHDLPIVVEAVDTQEKVDEILPLIDDLLTGGLVTLQPVTARRPDRRT